MPLVSPVQFTRPSKTRQGEVIRIDPYLLGLMIGDGHMTDNGLGLTTIDDPIREYVEDFTNGDIHWDGEKHLTFRGDIKKGLRKQLESYGLWNHRSNDKFIPKNYLFASLDVRYDLMAGLIDSDGYIDDRGHISYCSISEQLAKDVQHLARSLGCKASITDRIPTYHLHGEKLNGQKAYNVWIQGGEETKERFSKLPRKRDRIKPFNGGVSEAGRRVVSIEHVGKEDGVCIAINHPLGLYAAQDFIVTHNSDLMLGLSLSELSPHSKAIIFRRSYPELKDIVTRANEILDTKGAKFKGGTAMRFDGLVGKSLELGSVPDWRSAQKYKGRPHDLKLFDEVSDITEQIYSFLIGWARTTEEGVPVRVVAAGNPPTHSEGQWVIRRWAAWLDPTHPNKAEPGEKRYFATLDGIDTELDEEKYPEGSRGEEFEFESKRGNIELIKPKSRTFIPAKLDDNPFLAKTDYATVLGNMPEPYRSQLLYGDFGSSFKSDPYQVIPTNWVLQAEKRWSELESAGELENIINQTPAFGIDVSEAGGDKTTICMMNGNVVQFVEYVDVDERIELRIPLLQAEVVEQKAQRARRAPIGIDAIGVGFGLGSVLVMKQYNVLPIKVSRASKFVDRTGQFRFLNVRAELWWRLREMLDPSGGMQLAIPPNQMLRAELTAPKFERTPNDKIKIESKDNIRERIGRSPDLANALLLCMYAQKRSKSPLRMI